MKRNFVIVLLLVCICGYAQTNDYILGVSPIVSKERKSTLNIYKPTREVTKVIEGRLCFKGSSQGDFIQEKPSFKNIVFDKTDLECWRIELYSHDDADPSMSPEVSIYKTKGGLGCASFVDNVFESMIERESPHGPAWTQLQVIETADMYVFILSEAHDRWNGKIIMKWICKKGNFEDPKKYLENSADYNIEYNSVPMYNMY